MTSGTQPSAEPVLAQTGRILASPLFARSQALSRLLQFIVQVRLDGKEQEIKEYAIGVEVFERGADFDPRVDPVVRLQAAKLRSRLAEYYAAEGSTDPVVITVPKGGYVPTFAHREAATAATAGTPGPSIAVLPFVSMSSDPENDYFSDGLTEELINALAYVSELRVVARTSAFSFKNTSLDIREIGTRLNVRTVLEGSVRRAGSQLRVTAQLIDVATGYHMLSRTYPRELKDVFTLQEELAREVVSELLPQLNIEAPSLVHARTPDMELYDLYLKGMFAAGSSFHGPRQAVEIFRQALQRDPTYAPAWAGLANAYCLLSWFSFMPSRTAMPLAREAAEKALQFDERSGLAHAALGMVHCIFDWDWKAGERSFRRAVELQPSLALTQQFFAICCLMPQGRYQEAVAATELAMSLDPFNGTIGACAVYTYAASGDDESAMRQLALSLEGNPDHAIVHVAGALAHQMAGRLEESLTAYKTGHALAHGAAIGYAALGQVQARLGRVDEARANLDKLRGVPDNCFAMAMLQLGLGEIDEAIAWFEKGMDKREPHMITVTFDPRLASLLPEPRFKPLLARMGL